MKQSYDMCIIIGIFRMLARNEREEWRGDLLNLTCTLELREHTV